MNHKRYRTPLEQLNPLAQIQYQFIPTDMIFNHEKSILF